MKNDITEFRLDRGWTLDVLAEKSGISKNSWINLNNGVPVREITERRARDFMLANGWKEPRRFCVLYMKNYQSTVMDETWFDDFEKAKYYCAGKAMEITKKDRKNGGYCIVTNDYNEETGEYFTKLYDAVAEMVKWEEELEKERDEEEAKC